MRSRSLPPDATAEADPGRGLRDRPARAVPRQEEEGQGRQAGRLARLVQHALPGAARPGEGPALRLVRRGLWLAEHGRHDRRRAGAVRSVGACSCHARPSMRGPAFGADLGMRARCPQLHDSRALSPHRRHDRLDLVLLRRVQHGRRDDPARRAAGLLRRRDRDGDLLDHPVRRRTAGARCCGGASCSGASSSSTWSAPSIAFAIMRYDRVRAEQGGGLSRARPAAVR